MGNQLDDIKAYRASVGRPLVSTAPTSLTADECAKLKQIAASVGVEKVLAAIASSRGTYYSAAAGGRISSRVAVAIRKLLESEPQTVEVEEFGLVEHERLQIKLLGVDTVALRADCSRQTVYSAMRGMKISKRLVDKIRVVLHNSQQQAQRLEAPDTLEAEARAQLQQYVWNLGVQAAAQITGVPGEAICAAMSGAAVRLADTGAIRGALARR